MKRKIAALFVASLMAFSTAACGGAGNTNSNRTASDEASSESTDAGTDKEEQAEETVQVTVEKQVLADWDEGLTITLTGIEADAYSTKLKLLVENNTSYNVSVISSDISVNDCYLDSGSKLGDVPAGKKANQELMLGGISGASFLTAVGIDPVGSVECSFKINDNSVDTSSGASAEIYHSDPVEIKTSAYDQINADAISEGTELYNQDGVRIVAKGIVTDITGYGPCLYVENTTDKDLMLLSYDTTVNSFVPEFGGSMQWLIPAGKQAAEIMILYYDSTIADESAVSDITDIEFGFYIADMAVYDGWSDEGIIADTGMLTYTP